MGLWFLSPTGETLSAVGVALVAPLDDWWAAQKSLHPLQTAWVGARLNLVAINTGTVIAAEDLPIAGSVGFNGSDTLPAETSLVVSLRTPFASPRMRGRVYLPPLPRAALDANGNVITGTKTGCADNMAGLLSAINSSTGTDAEAVVYSRRDRSTTTISSVRCGAVMDVQRSRRRSLVENYYSVSL